MNYAGEQQTFSSTQLVAMFLGKLRDTASVELKAPVSDVVIAVPSWYTDVQRRALIDAAQIASLNPLRIINETTAVALGYGITKSDLPEPENPRHVMFIDVGHSNLTATVVAFAKNQLHIKGSASDRQLGGRDIDYALVQHFSEEFKTKYKIDVLSNPKATFRLVAGCEKLKKVLSANTEANLSVESIMNDVDASSRLTREKLEQLIAPLLDRVQAPILQALQEASLTPEQIHSIELVGGTSRVPAIKSRIQAVFGGRHLSTTLNQDEAVARGATFACAMLSPVFKVREFTYHDIASYPIKVQWEPTPEEPESELVVFPKGNTVPSTKILTTARTAPFDIEAAYAEPENLPGGISPWIGRATVKGSKEAGDAPTYKVKCRLNGNGLLGFEGAYWEEIEEKEDQASMDVDAAAAAGEGEVKKKKKIVRKREVPVVVGYGGVDASILNNLKELEASMHAADKLVKDTEVCVPLMFIWAGAYVPYRIARTLLKSISMTRAPNSMSATPLMSNPPTKNHSSLNLPQLKTGSTPRKERTPPNPPTPNNLMHLKPSAIRSPSVTPNTLNSLERLHSFAKRSTTIWHRRNPISMGRRSMHT